MSFLHLLTLFVLSRDLKACVDPLQEYCRLVHHREAVPVTSIEELKAFYEWFVRRIQENDSGTVVIGRSWKHIASMVYFHGYITPEEWREGGFPDPNSHFTFRQDTMRVAKAHGKHVSVTSVAYGVFLLCVRPCFLLACRQTPSRDKRGGL